MSLLFVWLFLSPGNALLFSSSTDSQVESGAEAPARLGALGAAVMDPSIVAVGPVQQTEEDESAPAEISSPSARSPSLALRNLTRLAGSTPGPRSLPQVFEDARDQEDAVGSPNTGPGDRVDAEEDLPPQFQDAEEPSDEDAVAGGGGDGGDDGDGDDGDGDDGDGDDEASDHEDGSSNPEDGNSNPGDDGDSDPEDDRGQPGGPDRGLEEEDSDSVPDPAERTAGADHTLNQTMTLRPVPAVASPVMDLGLPENPAGGYRYMGQVGVVRLQLGQFLVTVPADQAGLLVSLGLLVLVFLLCSGLLQFW